MEMIFDIGKDISFVFNGYGSDSGQPGQPDFAALFTYNAAPIIGNAELSKLE